MAAQPCSWAAVGAANVSWNQARVAAPNLSRTCVMALAYTRTGVLSTHFRCAGLLDGEGAGLAWGQDLGGGGGGEFGQGLLELGGGFGAKDEHVVAVVDRYGLADAGHRAGHGRVAGAHGYGPPPEQTSARSGW